MDPREYGKVASEFVNAIRSIAKKPDNMDALEGYLSIHFQEWLDKYANNPEGLAHEMTEFAEMLL